MRNIEFRLMKENEANKVYKLGCRCFSVLKKPFISKPKLALIALINGEIIAGTTLKKIKIRENEYVGYVSHSFVKEEFRGQGIGKELYNKAIAYLDKECAECSEICATVLDDNKRSWKIFKNEGFNMTSSYSVLSKIGILGTIRLWKESWLFISLGHYLWWRKENEHKENSLLNMILFFAFNFILITIVSRNNFFASLGALLVLFIQLVGGFIGILFTKGKWIFKVGQGGTPLSFLISIFKGFVPVSGNWYPTDYFDNGIKRKLGIVSCFEWITLICVMIISMYYKNTTNFNVEILEGILLTSTPLLIYKIFATFPFEVFGGERVLKFSKTLYTSLSAISFCTIFVNILN